MIGGVGDEDDGEKSKITGLVRKRKKLRDEVAALDPWRQVVGANWRRNAVASSRKSIS